jgi:hypothetical protein
MHSKNGVILNPIDLRWRPGLIAMLVVALLLGLTARQAAATPQSQPFEAVFSGIFAITGDVGHSGLFRVEESGSGIEQGELGAFSYTTALLQNSAHIPPGCGSGSSTGVDGSSVLKFADGDLRLQRTSGTACFAFPTVQIEERWVIASGTGAYIGASGELSRELVGDVRYGTSAGTLSGTIRLH